MIVAVTPQINVKKNLFVIQTHPVTVDCSESFHAVITGRNLCADKFNFRHLFILCRKKERTTDRQTDRKNSELELENCNTQG